MLSKSSRFSLRLFYCQIFFWRAKNQQTQNCLFFFFTLFRVFLKVRDAKFTILCQSLIKIIQEMEDCTRQMVLGNLQRQMKLWAKYHLLEAQGKGSSCTLWGWEGIWSQYLFGTSANLTLKFVKVFHLRKIFEITQKLVGCSFIYSG